MNVKRRSPPCHPSSMSEQIYRDRFPHFPLGKGNSPGKQWKHYSQWPEGGSNQCPSTEERRSKQGLYTEECDSAFKKESPTHGRTLRNSGKVTEDSHKKINITMRSLVESNSETGRRTVVARGRGGRVLKDEGSWRRGLAVGAQQCEGTESH